MLRKLGRKISAMALFTVLTARAGISSADKDAEEKADKLFNEAEAQMKEGKYASACAKYEESQRLDRAWGTVFALAKCYNKAGQLSRAREYALAARAAAVDAKNSDRERRANEELSAIEVQMSKLEITIPVPLNGEHDLQVMIDKTIVLRENWRSVFTETGEHTITVTSGSKQWSIPISLKHAEQRKVSVPPLDQWEPPKDKNPQPPPSATPPLSPTVARTTTSATPSEGAPLTAHDYRVPGVVLMVFGAASLGVSVGFRLLRQDTIDRLDVRCRDGHCPADAAYLADQGKTYSAVWQATLGVGIAGMAAGATLLLMGTSTPPAPKSAGFNGKIGVTISAAGPASLGVGVTGRF